MRKVFIFFAFMTWLNSCNVGEDRNYKVNDRRELEVKADKEYEAGNYSKSVNYFTQLIQIDSLNGQHFFGRASANGRMGNRDNAIKDFLKSIQLHYRIGSCYYNIGLLNSYVNDSLASTYFKKALEIYPKSKIYPKKEDIQKEYDECINRLKK